MCKIEGIELLLHSSGCAGGLVGSPGCGRLVDGWWHSGHDAEKASHVAAMPTLTIRHRHSVYQQASNGQHSSAQ
jgi:hypothetical protein